MPSTLDYLQSKVRLSEGEKRLLKLLPPSGKRITTGELAKKFYAKRDEPFNARLVVVGMVRTLQRKIGTLPDAPIYVHTTERSGPVQMEVWRSRHAA